MRSYYRYGRKGLYKDARSVISSDEAQYICDTCENQGTDACLDHPKNFCGLWGKVIIRQNPQITYRGWPRQRYVDYGNRWDY